MTVGQLREQIAGVPGELEVEVFAGTAGEGVPVFRATRRTLPSAAFVLVPEEVEPHGGRPAGYIDPDADDSPPDERFAAKVAEQDRADGIDPDESPADSRVPDAWKDYAAQYGAEEAIERASAAGWDR